MNADATTDLVSPLFVVETLSVTDLVLWSTLYVNFT